MEGFTTREGERDAHIHLRRGQDVRRFLGELDTQVVYVDITGLPHHVWAALIKHGLAMGCEIRISYVEPAEYAFSEAPTEGSIFDLSDRILGIAPLPGFARLADPDYADEAVFVPLLGFEGTRFSYMLEQLQPPADRVVPIVGVPGFRPEYPFYTYVGNRSALTSTGAWARVLVATANCPFAAFYVLEDIRQEYPRSLLQVAPIGTKPHSVGAVLFALCYPDDTELIYDFPVRSSKRTVGAARRFVYDVGAFHQGLAG